MSKGKRFSCIEFEIFDLINTVRASPSVFVNVLEKKKNFFNKNDYEIPGSIKIKTYEGVSGVNRAISYLSTKEGVKKLDYSVGISLCCNDMIQNFLSNKLKDKFSNDKDLRNRMQKYGECTTSNSYCCEMIIFLDETNVQNLVSYLIVDDGNFERSNRNGLFSSEFLKIGIKFKVIQSEIKTSHQFICCMVLCDGFETNKKYINSLPSPEAINDYSTYATMSLIDYNDINVVPIQKNRLNLWIKRGVINVKYQSKLAKISGFTLFSPAIQVLFENRSYDFVFTFKNQDAIRGKINLVNNDMHIYEVNKKIYYIVKKVQLEEVLLVVGSTLLHKFLIR